LAEDDDGLRPVVAAEEDVELPLDDEEELVGVLVHVPDVLSQGVRDAHVVVVHADHDPRAVDIVKGSEGGRQIHRLSGRHHPIMPVISSRAATRG
jgi:hypothetical protein